MAYTKHRPFRTLPFESLESRRVLATLAGTVYEDVGSNVLEDLDPRIPGATVYLDANRNGVLDLRGFGIDPDEFEEGQVLNRVRQTLFPSATGVDNEPAFRVLAAESPGLASTGQRVFGLEEGSDWVNGKRLRFDFTLPVDSVSIDVVGSSGIVNANVRMEVFGEDNQLIESTSENSVASGEGRIMEITRSQKDISYAVAYVSSVAGAVKFDNLRADNAGSERSTLTSNNGFYRFIDVPAGEVTIAFEESGGYNQISPEGPHQQEVSFQGGLVNLDFGTQTSSISGFVFNDLGTVGTYEPAIDEGLAGIGVFLDANQNGLPDAKRVDIFPDSFLEDQVLDFVSNNIELSSAGADNLATNTNVVAATDPVATPEGKVFTYEGEAAWDNDNRLRADFASPAREVQIRFIGGTEGEERGRMVAYSAAGTEIGSVTTRPLMLGESQTLSIQRNGFDISYVVAFTAEVAEGNDTGSGRLSDLRTELVAEPVVITDEIGEYRFKPLVSGDYDVRILPAATLNQSFPSASNQRVILETGEAQIDVDFGFTVMNDPPIARNDSAITIEDAPISVGVLVNDSDPDGLINEDSLTIAAQPVNGSAIVTFNGLIEYTPNENFFGRDSIQYTILDDQGAISNTGVVTIDVTPVNDGPVAQEDVVAIIGAGATQIAVLANDDDIDSEIDRTSLTIIDQPNNGTIEIDEVTGVITYTALSAGNDTFSYVVDDEDGTSSNEATVTITSLASGTAPVAVDDAVTTLEGTAIEIAVTTNDTDADGTIDISSVFVVMEPANGSTVVQSNGRVAYQPDLGFLGEDSFSYRVRDSSGLVSNVAQVSITMSERDFPYQNPIEATDVDGNGSSSPRDVLFIISELNEPSLTDDNGQIIVDVAPGQVPLAYYDVDANGFITPGDVLRVITRVDEINAMINPAGEPDDDDQIAAAVVASIFAQQFDALDDIDEDEEA